MGRTSKTLAVVVLAALILLAACASTGQTVSVSSALEAAQTSANGNAGISTDGFGEIPSSSLTSGEQAADVSDSDGTERPSYELLPGTGNFIDRQAARRGRGTSNADADVVLNFEGSNLQEVIKTMLGDILGVNYMIDPDVSGTVSLATMRPMSMDAVVPTLEAVLEMNDAVLTLVNGIYYVTANGIALTNSLKPRLKPSSDGGYQVLIVPLEYVAASAMQSVLQPLLSASAILSVDAERNHLIIGGTQTQLETVLDTVDIFDVNQMTGMSIGIFTLQTAEATHIHEELRGIFGADATGPLAGMVRFVTIERLNALVVITPQEKYLTEVQRWIERLDQADAAAGLNMYVYPVQNARADRLAELLNQLFADRTAAGPQSSVGNGVRSPSPFNSSRAAASAASGGASTAATLSMSSLGQNSADIGSVRIIADDENNSLVIMATRAGHAKITSAIRKLDVLPLQVLVEAMIVEISLTDELSYGLQWFFTHGFDNNDKHGTGKLFPLTVGPSFSYSVTGSAGETRAVLDLLAADSRLDVLSSPSLMVLDNHTATIRVGDQVPVRTSETTSLSSSGIDPLVTSTIQYRDTGVLLEVTPRVNLGGMVVLEITQDVNDVDKTTTSEIDSPTIIQRRITTTVAVQSGETVVLGGLIRENTSVSEAGIPGLRDIPVVGRLFGSRTTSNARTELLVLITPRAVANAADAREISQEMRKKMSGIDFSQFRSTVFPPEDGE